MIDDFAAVGGDAEDAAGAELRHVGEKAVGILVERFVAVDHVATEMVDVDLQSPSRQRRDKFDLRAEIESAVRVVQQIDRFFPKSVARQQKQLPCFIEQCERPHPFGSVEPPPTIAVKELDQYFGIARRAELKPRFCELIAKLDVIVDFAVEREDFVFVAIRLPGAVVEIDDGKPRIQEERRASICGSTAIGA